MAIWKFFLLTLLLELPLVVLWLRTEWRKALVIGFLLNLFTWPLLVALISQTNWNIQLMECVVALVEGCGYRIFFKRKWSISIALAFLVNGLSYGFTHFFFK